MARDDELQVDLFLRDEASPAVTDQQRRVRSRLERTLLPGALTVHEHPRRIPTEEESVPFDGYSNARAWAKESGVSLSPFFERRESYDPSAERVREMVTLPVLWLTVSEASDVHGTYPHVDGEVETVSDAVSALLDDETLPRDAAD